MIDDLSVVFDGFFFWWLNEKKHMNEGGPAPESLDLNSFIIIIVIIIIILYRMLLFLPATPPTV